MLRTRRTLAVALAGGLVAALAVPALASDPASSELEGSEGGTVTASWTGTIPPGVGEGINCAEYPASDTHTIAVTVPDGAEATLTVTQTYAPDFDPEMAITTPDGTVIESDDTIGADSEQAVVRAATSGTYTVSHCHYVGVATDYEAVAELEVDGAAPVEEEPTAPVAAGDACPAPAAPSFEEAYVDESRAGGEPLLALNAEGELLWGSHAGTTHFYTPTAPSPGTAAFVENYLGQTYTYRSTDGGLSWEYVLRQGPGAEDVASIAGIPASGFSDPEFAIDQAGNLWTSEINLANVAVSKSSDGGASWTLQNVFAFTSSDRQWMAADREDELYMTANGFGGGPFPGDPTDGTAGPVGNVGHFMAKSTDGGVTWNGASYTNPDGIGDIQIDHDTGVLYELSVSGDGTIGLARFPAIRDEMTDFTVDISTITEGVGLTGVQRLIDPTFDLDDAGNIYVTWTDNGQGAGGRAQGIYYSASTDGGDTWLEPVRVDEDVNGDVWPWIAAGDPGHAVVVWLETNEDTSGAALPGEVAGSDAPWVVKAAVTDTALGCGDGTVPGFVVTQASAEHVHTGTICQHGTVCQTDLTDRRLGDYFSVIADPDGRIHIAVSDTRQGGAVALPLHIRQTGGPLLAGPGGGAPGGDGGGSGDGDGGPSGPTPVTGGGAAVAALLLVGAATSVRRRR